MSEQIEWVSSPPTDALEKWCNREVNYAINTITTGMLLMPYMPQDTDHFVVEPVAGGEVDIEINTRSPLHELLREAAEEHVCFLNDPVKAGIYDDHRERVDTALQAIEAVIAEIRSWYKEGKPS